MAANPDKARDDLEEEFNFTEVLIESLDQGADDYPDKLQDLQAQKTELLKRLDALGGSSRPQSQGMDVARDLQNAWWNATMDGRPGNGGDSSRTVSGSSGGSLSSLSGTKRPLPNSLSLDTEQQPSKRPTPEPSNAETPPSSDDSFTIAPTDLSERAKKRQQMGEAALGRRREIELADAQLARSLDVSQNRPFPSSTTSARPGVQTTIGHNGSFQRAPPKVKLERERSPRPYASGPYGYNSVYNTAQPRSIKPEPQPKYIKSELSPNSQRLVQRPRPTPSSAVVDLTSVDDDDDDVREIAPTSFTPGKRPVKRETFGLVQRQPMPGAYPSPYPSGRQVNGSNYANPVLPPAAPQYARLQAPLSATSNALGGIKYAANSFASQLSELSHLVNGSGSGAGAYPDSANDESIYGGTRALDVYAGQDELFRERYDTISAHDPGKTKEEIEALLAHIRPDEDMPAESRVHTPEALTITLHKYQEMGLTWLKEMEEGPHKGSILADDMGLGKTIQAISLFVTRRSDDPRCRTTLIVAPVALTRQWQQEIESKIKPGLRHRLTTFIHHGQAKKKSYRELQVYDVVITTYGSLAAELKKQEAFRLRQKIDPNTRERPSEQCALLAPEANWYRVVLDEAQCIKNKSTQSAKAAFALRAKYRLCMTGTPMMNNVDEFFSLVHFVGIKPYCRWEKFRMDFSNPLKRSGDYGKERAMHQFQALCKAVMLRRTKKSMFEGQPILVLPERTTELDHPEFDEEEKKFYDALQQQTQVTFNKYLAEGSVGRHYSNVLVLLLRLRQAACHPHLIRDFAISAVAGVEPNDLIKLAETLVPDVVGRIKEKGGAFECNICMDVTPNPAIFIPCGHDACAECFARITDPANAIAAGNENGGTKAKCPSCRSDIDSKNITDFHSFKQVHQRELLTEEERQRLGGDDSETEDDDEEGAEVNGGDDSETESDEEDEVDEQGNLVDFVVDDDATESEGDEPGDLDGLTLRKDNAGPSRADGGRAKSRKFKEKSSRPEKSSGPEKSGKSKKSKRAKGKGKKKDDKKITLADLRRLGSRNIKARKAYLRKLRDSWMSSAKIDKTLEILRTIMDVEEGGEKVLIFSQWTSLLDLLEIPIEEKGWGYKRYDGSMNSKDRADAVDEFKASPHLRIMLVSLKAGNAGLNLNMASQVIVLDPFWNPYIEEQAIDRAHRLGQTRPVTVHRMLIKETVEDRICEIQERKRELIGTALDEKAGARVSRLGVQELAYLFGVTANPNQVVNYRPQNAHR
ncbi:hypothetical protein B0A55_04182 [Friedmanniomyces simplex]|uniref:Uncharacterized protein n=1 Tax=Friedmanniomyces simplex TaxID=329884 RepID=A0A4U0XKJ7_9PEZI|nr:hypothetical protein B0A55_04182 [Friedmanniomyces simplex]